MFFSAPILPFTAEGNLPVLPYMTLFDLHITTKCDIDSLNLILCYMPNLRQFIITIQTLSRVSLFWEDLLNGQHWQRLLTKHVPRIDVFDLFMNLILDPYDSIPDMDTIVHSFDYFATKYDDWHVAINQSKYSIYHRRKIIILIYI